MKEADKIRTTKKQEKCEFCNELFWNLDHHSKTCDERKQFMGDLDKEGILIRSRFDDESVWVSGGLKVILSLRGKLSTKEFLDKENKSRNKNKEDIKLIKNLLKFENQRAIRIEYDGEDDELDIKIQMTGA